MVREFIEGWDLMQILGEGTFAEVKLLVNRDTGEACAMKEVDVKNRPDLQVKIILLNWPNRKELVLAWFRQYY